MHATLTFSTQPGGRFFTRECVRGYCFGFNGKEKVDEVYGDANAYDYGFRMYDPRVARFLSVDPLTKKFPSLTPYQYASNNPIWNIDIDGLEGTPWNRKENYQDRKDAYGGIDDVFVSSPEWSGIHGDQTIRYVRFDNGNLVSDQVVVAGDPAKPVITVVARVTPTGTSYARDVTSSETLPIDFNSNQNSYLNPAIANNTYSQAATSLAGNSNASVNISGVTTLPQGANINATIDGVNMITTTDNLAGSRQNTMVNGLIAAGVNPAQINILPPQYNQPTPGTSITIAGQTFGTKLHEDIPSYTGTTGDGN